MQMDKLPIKTTDTVDVNMVMATGCPPGEWETVLPVLTQMGLNPAGDRFARWQDELLPADGLYDPRSFEEPVHPNHDMIARLTELLWESSSKTLLLADSRNLRLLDFWAEHFRQAKFLLFYTSAELAVTDRILKGEDPHQPLDMWQAAGRHLLHFLRRHRRQALLFNVEAVIRNPLKLVPACERIGLALQRRESVSVPSTPLSLERLVARYWLDSQPAVQLLQAELEASSYPLGDSLPAAKWRLIELIDSFRQQSSKELAPQNELEEAKEACQKLETENEVARQENDFLLQQLHQVQEELEAVFLQKQRLEGEGRENGKLLQSRIKQLQQTLSFKERALQEKQQCLAGMEKSASWKITAPMRTLARVLRRGNKSEIKAWISLIKASGCFDEAWYLAQYPNVGKSGLDPVEHYLRSGAAEGRNPSPSFDTEFYLEFYPDVARAGMNPLVHYIQYGREEGRRTGP
jgi:hypothetical protein